MSEISDDIKSAVSAGIVTEAQAASLLAHVQSRQGQRDHMVADDEPFEFFRGFAEIFVTVGLSLLLTKPQVISICYFCLELQRVSRKKGAPSWGQLIRLSDYVLVHRAFWSESSLAA